MGHFYRRVYSRSWKAGKVMLTSLSTQARTLPAEVHRSFSFPRDYSSGQDSHKQVSKNSMTNSKNDLALSKHISLACNQVKKRAHYSTAVTSTSRETASSCASIVSPYFPYLSLSQRPVSKPLPHLLDHPSQRIRTFPSLLPSFPRTPLSAANAKRRKVHEGEEMKVFQQSHLNSFENPTRCSGEESRKWRGV